VAKLHCLPDGHRLLEFFRRRLHNYHRWRSENVRKSFEAKYQNYLQKYPILIMDTTLTEFLFKDETYETIGICMSVHQTLGHGFLEIVYKDAIELEMTLKKIKYERERAYEIEYKGLILPHKFYADFVVDDKIILEVKAAEGGLANDQLAQTLNYLRVSNCRIGLLVNFGRTKLEYKRLIY
jgi:GxxExxY protein